MFKNKNKNKIFDYVCRILCQYFVYYHTSCIFIINDDLCYVQQLTYENGRFKQKQQRISSFLSSKKQKRENKDGVSCILLRQMFFYKDIVKNGCFEQKQQRITSFLSSKKQKRKNKDAVSCIIEYYYHRCFFTKIL